MKRALLLLAAVCFFIFSNAVTKGQQKIIIRGNMSFPPYEFINGNGEPDGLNVDLTRAVMKELNLPYEIKLDIWKDILPDLSKGHIDLVMGVLKSEDSSSKDFIYSDEHGYIKLNIIFRKDSPVYALKDLQNKKIIVLKNAISELRLTPIKKDDGTLQCVIITAVDQTEMVRHNEKLEAEKIKLDLALEAGGVSAWIYDPQTQVFSGLKGETIAGKGITLEENFSKLHPEDVEMQKTILNELLQGVKTKASSTSRYLNEDGTYHFYESHLITKKENGKTIILGTQKDITEKMLRKKELERYQATLEKEKERAEQADKLKSAFLANMSHEIRTPLNAIVGFSELLQTEEDPQQRAIFMNIVNDNNEQLLRLVNDILDLSKIESGFIELKPTTFDLSIMVQEVYQSLKQRYPESEVNFILEIPHKKCYVTLDKGRLFQLYTNFVTNAFKHTSKGYIRIGYKSDEQGIKIYVEDTGCGISKDKQSLLFGRFAKLDDFSSGTGLGLAICKAITEAEHGTIGAISEEGKGSLFWAWLPSKIKIE